jgi:hypothetical protein
MIGIQLDGDTEFLETEPGTTISMKIENPLFAGADKLSPGSYSLPFNLPGGDMSEKNSAKLHNPDVIENNEAYQIQKATLFFDGNRFKSGNLKSNSFDTKMISAYFTFGLNSISSDFKTAKLRDVLSENVVISSAEIVKRIYVKKLDGGEYDITLNGTNYQGNVFSVANAINADATAAVNAGKPMPYAEYEPTDPTPGGMAAGYLKIWMVVVTIYHDPVTEIDFTLYNEVKDPLIEISIDVSDRTLYQVEFDIGNYFQGFRDYLDGYITGVYPDNKLRWPVRFNSRLHSDVPKTSQIINGVNGNGLMINYTNWGGPGVIKNTNSIQPFVLLKYVLDKIGTVFGFEYEGDFYEDPELPKILLDNTTTLDTPQTLYGDSKFIFWRRSFNVNELVPELSVVDFYKALSSRYNLAVYVNERTKKVRLLKREPIAIANEYEDITSFSSRITSIVDDRVTGFKLKVAKESSDSFSLEESVTIGTPEVEYEVKCGRLHRMTSEVVAYGGLSAVRKTLLGPYTSQANNEKFGLRVFYYKGMTNNGSWSYPSADINGTTIFEELAAPGGIYDKYWKYWLRFEKNRIVIKLGIAFDFRQILNLDHELKRRFNRINYMIKSLDLKMTNDGLRVTNAELYTMR